MLIAQITDLHLNAEGRPFGQLDTAALVRDAISSLNAFRPRLDLVLITGDLVNDGSAEEYRFARSLLNGLEIPWQAIPGNHDDRDQMRAALGDRVAFEPGSRFLQYRIEGRVRILALDTVVPRRSEGALCAERLDWLTAALAERPAGPTMLMMHHPPFRTGMRDMDAIGLVEGADALEALVRANPQIERVICGHVHRPITRRWAGTLAMIAPGVSHQLELDLTNSQPPAYNEEPPAWLLHRWDVVEGLVTHAVQIRRAPGPFYFRDLPPGQ